MKKQIIKYVTGIAVMVCVCFGTLSCDVTDLDPTGSYGENVVYNSIKNVDLYVKDFYRLFYANADIALGSSSMDDGATDLIKYSWYGVADGTMNRYFYSINFVTPEGNFRSNWLSMYDYIRRLNEYFADLSNGYGSKLNPDELAIRTAEVRFMRAFAYQELVIRHGGVILRIDESHVDGPNQRAKARSSESDCWDFIIGEYEKAAPILPKTWAAADAGRLTQGAAYGMIARASLYAGRWQDAIDACDEVFKLGYALLDGKTVANYQKIYSTVNNSELILPVYFQQGVGLKQHSFDGTYGPPGDGLLIGKDNNTVGAAATPSDEYASSFDIKVGDTWEAFDWSKLATYGNAPWTNREPRFYASILYNGATWKSRTIQLYKDGLDGYMDFAVTGQDAVHNSTTGYLFRKFLKEDTKINFTNILSDQYWIEMRLAEIYFIRSEANARKNEFRLAYEDLNAIRDRVGLPARAQKSTWADYLKDLSKERICELGLEGHRYFDLVRWGIAHETLNGKRLHGVKITPVSGGFSYERVECDTQDRLFPEKYTVYPIPYAELQNNSLCQQSDPWK